MRSLFLKIFLSFLLILLLVSTAVVLLTYFRDQEFPPLAHQDFARQAVAEYGREAIKAFEHSSNEEVDKFSGHLRERSGIYLLLFDHHGRPLTNRRVPRRIQHMVQRAMQTGEVVFPVMGNRNGFASAVVGAKGETYFVSILLPERPQAQNFVEGVTHGLLGWRLLLLLIITAGVCYALARSLTAPIGRLRQATRRFASGDLSTRIGDDVKGRNELAELSHDFDEMAEKIEGLVGGQKTLLRDISHELRSPLARLGIALELARQQEGGELQRKSLDRIGLEAERMNSMIGQLLNLTRLESREFEISFEEFDLRDLLACLVNDAAYEAKVRQCEVVLQAPTKVSFLGSQNLLAQAFENVIRNGVKYTAEGSLVSIKLWVEEEQIKVQIADAGIGVPDDALGKIFDPFFRVADARDRQSGGTGIGLAIAKQSIILHGGTISAYNQNDGGLLVDIVLPVNN